MLFTKSHIWGGGIDLYLIFCILIPVMPTSSTSTKTKTTASKKTAKPAASKKISTTVAPKKKPISLKKVATKSKKTASLAAATRVIVPRQKKLTSTDSSAVIMTGGKQYRVVVGDVISTETISGSTLNAGDTIVFDQVLLLDTGSDTKIGTPHLSGVTVSGTILEISRTPKLRVQKFRSKSNYHKAYGHRQPFMKIQIEKVG